MLWAAGKGKGKAQPASKARGMPAGAQEGMLQDTGLMPACLQVLLPSAKLQTTAMPSQRRGAKRSEGPGQPVIGTCSCSLQPQFIADCCLSVHLRSHTMNDA